jgi:hypothetical protein
MAKAEYGFRIGNIRGWITGTASGKRQQYVTVSGWVDEQGPQHDRPLRSDMSPADARKLAARLIEEADRVDLRVPVKGDAGAKVLALALPPEGFTPQCEWEGPGEPCSNPPLDRDDYCAEHAAIADAAEQAPVESGEPGRLTIAGALLHLGDVQQMLTDVDRYTAMTIPADVFSNLTALIADLTLASAETLYCYRCGRKYRLDEREQLERTTDGQFKCSPDGPNHANCMRALGLTPARP